MNVLRFLIKQHPVLTAVFALALIATVAFSVRIVSNAIYFNDPAHREQTLEDWMTPRYVGMSWGLPPEVLGPILHLGPDFGPRDGKPPKMGDIAASLNMTLPELEAQIRAAKTRMEAGKP